MNKLIELRRAKRLALSLLLIAAATFVVTLFLPPNFWVSGVKAIAEAAMVGALADWFAVVALFRRVPIPIISRHTAIIPRNKDRIGENLGQFVQEKFLDTQSLVALIRRHEPALLIGNWFSQPENARRVGQHLLQIMSGFLELTDDARIQRLLKRAVHRAIDKVDLSGTSALMLESMTKNDRHQVLLDTLIAQLIALLQRDKSRKFIAQQIVRWLESEHPLKAKILPTEWLGEHSAELVSDAVNSLLDDISRDRAHQIDPTEPRFIWRAVPIQLVGLSLLIVGNLLSPHVWLWSVLGTSLYAFGIGLIFPTLFRFTLFSNKLPKGTVSASLNMVILMVMSVSVEIGRWLWFNGGRLPFHLLAVVAGVIVVFTLAGLLNRVRQHQAAELVEEQ